MVNTNPIGPPSHSAYPYNYTYYGSFRKKTTTVREYDEAGKMVKETVTVEEYPEYYPTVYGGVTNFSDVVLKTTKPDSL